MNEQPAPQRTQARTEPGGANKNGARRVNAPVLRQSSTSGARGFTVVLGIMFGIIGLLWLVAWLVAPH